MARLSNILAGAAGICFLVVGVGYLLQGSLGMGAVFAAVGLLTAATAWLPLLRR